VLAAGIKLFCCRKKGHSGEGQPPRPEPQAQERGPDKNREQIAIAEAKSENLPTVPHKVYLDYQRTKCLECAKFCVEVLGFLGVAFYAYITYGEWQEMQTQTSTQNMCVQEVRKQTIEMEKQMRVDQRAWVEMRPTVQAATVVQGKPMAIGVLIRNIGKTVARNIDTTIVVEKLAPNQSPSFDSHRRHRSRLPRLTPGAS